MRDGLILLLLLAMPWRTQTTTGKAETSGPCSPAVSGNKNQFTTNCSGLDKKQGQKMLEVLNKILANQIDPNEVLGKLDEITSRLPGGDSFPYLELSDKKDYVMVVDHGDNQLSGLKIAESNDPHPGQEEFERPILDPHFADRLFSHNFYDAPAHDMTIGFIAGNGEWFETLQVRNVEGRLASALRVVKVTPKFKNPEQLESVELSEIWCKVDPNYPLVNGLVAWNEHLIGVGKPITLASVPCPRH